MVGSKQHDHVNNKQVEVRDKVDQIANIHLASKLSAKYQPNDSGHEKMASILFQAMFDAGESGFLCLPRYSERVDNDAETDDDDLDTFRLEAKVLSSHIDEKIAAYMAAREVMMRDMGGKTSKDIRCVMGHVGLFHIS
ncbi:hypothetical protein QBC41DRAFT_379454 [Cercophora samala]|uniref:Uncharacterized protein n=1 Tax=Cercophora samala TaxID=330535 RepID=A0AA40DDK8_9PEZI|nr:hypothetical protein QBC41DRAFT_379454 [Cercophora samala]